MGMKFTKIPADTFQKIQLNAGILVDAFDPATGEIGNLCGATTGGIQFASNPSFEDFGEDVDNCPPNMKELKKLMGYDPAMSGNFVYIDPTNAKALIGAADIDSNNPARIIPRSVLEAGDFKELWWIGDYSDINTGATAGYLAIHLMNALNTSGFQIKSQKNSKTQFAFDFHGHVSMAAQDVVPFEVYCKSSSVSPADKFVLLSDHVLHLTEDDTYTLKATTNPSAASVSWASSSTTYASVAAGVVTAEAAGSAIITASITVDGVTYSDTCTVIVEASA